jgi:hypothetical protein
MSKLDPKWLDRLLWMAIPTVLSLLGQLALYYFTRQRPIPQTPPAKAQLRFGLAKPIPSAQDGKRVVTHSVEFWNDGTKEAEDVRLSVSFPSGAKVIRAKIEPSGGPAVDYKVMKRPDLWLLTFPTINPKESCSATFFLDTKTDDPVKVNLRSKGENGRQFPAAPSDLSVSIYPPASYAAIAVQVILSAVLVIALGIVLFLTMHK